MSLRVAIVPLAAEGVGGLGVDVRNLANGLAGRGHEVSVVTVGATARVGPNVAHVTLDPVPPRPLARRFNLGFGFSHELSARSWEVVHVFGCLPSYLTFAAIVAARRRRRTVVWTPMLHPARALNWRGRGALRAMELFDHVAPRAARWVDAVGAATAEEAQWFTRLGARRVELLPPVVEDGPVLAREEGDAFRVRHGLVGAPIVLVAVSRAERRKGLDFAFTVLRRLRASVPDARLLVLGLAAETRRAAPAGAHYAGWVDDRDLVRAFRAADAVLVPSVYEAFSRVVIEAWHQARPVVVTDGVGLAPVVSQTGGRVVRYGDATAAAAALAELLADAEGARDAGRRGRVIVERQFVLSRLLDDSEALYRALARPG
jgi:glycosyltransferase involved in cell wall biosynthesis